jgi:hypothetical protein
MLSIKSQMLEHVKEIKQNLENGGDAQSEKKKFYKAVEEIKVKAIKSDEILDVVNDIRTILVNNWRPKQHSILSGIILWVGLISLGSLIIYLRDIPFLLTNSIWSIVLSIILLFIGWFLINLGVHNFGHYIAGRIVGIKYNAWVKFHIIGQWALILDYKSYLKASFNKRQVVHISGPFCTLATPWIIYFLIWHPVMLGIAIYMFVASLPLMFKKGWDYGRIFKENKLKKEYMNLKNQK